jgi:acyl carrier protein
MSSRLNRVIAETFRVSPESITPEAGPHSITAWDSAGHMNLILALQKEFGVEFGDDEVVELVSVEAIAEALAGKGVAGEGA